MIILLLNLLLLGFLSLGLYRKWRHLSIAFFYWPGLLLKILCGWGMLSLYRYYYGLGDFITYHREASALASLFWQEPGSYFNELLQIGFLKSAAGFAGEERVVYFVKLISPVYILSGSNSWIVAAWLSLFSFLGLFWLAKRLSLFYPGSSLAAAVAFLLWPSVLIWTGSISKEALVMPAIALLVGVVLPAVEGRGRSTLLQWVLALLAAWLIWRIKYYFALPIFAILAALVLAQWARKWQISHLKLLLLAGGVLVVTGLLLSQLHPNLHPEYVLGVLVDNYRVSVLSGEAHKSIHYPNLQPTPWSVLYYSPKALAAGLLMPLPFLPLRLEVLPLLAGVENLLILMLLISAFYKLYRQPYQAFSLPALGLAFYICFLAVAMAIASPNMGSLLRYRTAYLPFAIFLLLYWLFPTGWGRKPRGVDSLPISA